MPESALHEMLIATIKKWIKEYCVEENTILSHSKDTIKATNNPPIIGTHIPDIYAIGRKTNRIIIGEAKTTQADLESEHSERQIISYLEFCKNKPNSILVMCVPFIIRACAISIIDYVKRKNLLTERIQTKVISPHIEEICN